MPDIKDLIERLDRIRVFARDIIDTGHDRSQIGNAYCISDEVDVIRPQFGALSRLEKESAELREALSFYADPKNYKGGFVPGHSEQGAHTLAHYVNLVRRDGGAKARRALTKESIDAKG